MLERVFGGEGGRNKPKRNERRADLKRGELLEIWLRWKRLTFSEKLIHFGMMRNVEAEILFFQRARVETQLSGGGTGTLGQTGGWMRG